MKKKTMVAAILFSVLLLLPAVNLPVTTADVFLPSGPPSDYSEWIYQGLHIYDLQWDCHEPLEDISQLTTIGWKYTDGPAYDPLTQTVEDKVEWWNPEIEGPTWIPFSTWVMVFGVLPGVVVSPDQVPPSIVLKITWNGVPYAVTLEAPDVVGMQYPPVKYGDPVPHVPEGIRDQFPSIETVYPWVYPVDTPGSEEWKKAYYNVWFGDWDSTGGPMPSGLYFWYIFHPNVGDWWAIDSMGWTKHPPTYDITASLEFSNSHIWFNHKCFDVRLLEVHKDIAPNHISGDAAEFGAPEISNMLTIINVGKVPAHGIDITESFPIEEKKAVIPKWDTATAKLFDTDPFDKWDGRHIFATPLLLREALGQSGWPFVLPPPFDILYPGETLIIAMEASVNVPNEWEGCFVIDTMVSASEIPPWKYPRALDVLVVGNPYGSETILYDGQVLDPIEGYFMPVQVSCPDPCNWNPIPQEYEFEWTLDPIPVDLNDDSLIDAQDVALVREAIVGLTAYDLRMDVNANNKVDTQDLAAFKLAAN